jgi:hypothetical protein
MWSAIALSPGIIDAMPKMKEARHFRALPYGRSGTTGADKMGAKCRDSFGQREHRNATNKHQQRDTGIRVLNALYCAHRPNSKFERDPNASHPGPSTLALGFF